MRKTAKVLLSLFGWLFTLGLTCAIIAGIIGIVLFRHYTKDLPDYSQLAKYDPPTVTRLYAADGRLLAEYATEKRVFVPLSAMPTRVINAFLAAEDKNFYVHEGIDLTGIARAIYTNVIQYGQGKGMVGGSTITQQVVKNFLLSSEKSIERKVKEAVLAMRISQVYSKDKILELYLNEIFLGYRSYGVAAAALNYFNKSLEELTVEEAAFLATLPKAPSYYDPRRNYEASKTRRDWVIEQMVRAGFITTEEALEAQKQPITLRKRDPDDVVSAEFFAEEVRREIAAKYGENTLYEGGLVVKTTLDPRLQKIADRALRKALIDYDRRRGYRGPVKRPESADGWKDRLTEMMTQDHHLIEGQQLAAVIGLEPSRALIGFADGSRGIIPFSRMKWTRRIISDGVLGPEVKSPSDILHIGDIIMVGPLTDEERKELPEAERKDAWDLQQEPAVNGALVALDPHTGKVLALSGGYAYGGTQFNRATQALRQPGSSYKPFVYGAALENGFTPSTIVMDAPVELSQGAGQEAWRPENYAGEYLGPTTLRVGLEKSRNTMTVRIAQMMGINKALEIGKRFGIYDNPPRNFSIVLGTSETTLLKLTNAYGMIVNGGRKITPSLIERIDDRNGKTVFRRDMRICNGCRIASSLDMGGAPPIPADTREQIMDPRVAYQLTSMLEGVVQRGTAVRARAVGKPLGGKTGTTNDSLDTWFVGFAPDLAVGVFVGYDRPQTLGKKETGASVALPGFVNFMQEALKDKPAQPFRTPPGIRLMRVDLKSGLPLDQAPEVGKVIQEAFIADGGPPIFVPGRTQKVDETTLENMPANNTMENDMQQVPAPLPWLEQSPPRPHVIPPPVGSDPVRAPVQGTGGLY